MSKEETPQEKAKEIVTELYQPLGLIPNSCNSSELWEHAKGLAKISARNIRDSHPMYIGNINPKWLYWDNVLLLIIEL